jgi:hypothetical protein
VDPSWYDSPCREGVCDRGFLAAQDRDSTPRTYSRNASAQGAFGGERVRNGAMKTACRGASTAYEKTPDPLKNPGFSWKNQE